ncbi:MAG TPA: hypothetical protein VGA61_09390 [Anaerolineae bacterium]
MNDPDFQSRVLSSIGQTNGPRPAGRHAVLWQQASHLYWRTYCWGRLLHLWSLLSRRPRRLLDLNHLCCPACHQFYAGLQTVPVARILGSEGRLRDFDWAFRPLSLRSRERWLRIALATLQGTPVPPVQLIQVGGVYFVRDGHHRISVARAWGQDFIDAEVTVWEGARGPLAVSLPFPAAAHPAAVAEL